MAATNAPAGIKVETEDDQQILYCTISAVGNNTTTDFTNWTKNILHISAIPSTATAVGATVSAGVITWLIGTGTPNLIIRLAFD